MKKTHIYRSFYFVANEPIEPIYIVHKAENIKNANYNAKSYIRQYYDDRRKSTNFLNTLMKTVSIKTIRLKKL
jgi:hypothetical protein